MYWVCGFQGHNLSIETPCCCQKKLWKMKTCWILESLSQQTLTELLLRTRNYARCSEYKRKWKDNGLYRAIILKMSLLKPVSSLLGHPCDFTSSHTAVHGVWVISLLASHVLFHWETLVPLLTAFPLPTRTFPCLIYSNIQKNERKGKMQKSLNLGSEKPTKE